MGPFAKYAQKYWDKNYRVLPTEQKTKQPAAIISRGWPGFAANIPSPARQAQLLSTCSACGIAVCLGSMVWSSHYLLALDIDVDAWAPAVEAIIGSCKSRKRGARGRTLFARAAAETKIKSQKIVDAAKNGVVDVLSFGKITIQPDSTHPSGIKYEEQGTPLYETDEEDHPVVTPATISLLKLVIGSEEAAQLLGGVGTHDAGCRLAAKLVSAGCGDAMIHSITRALLPPGYSGNSLDELPEWIESAYKKGFDEPPITGGRSSKTIPDKLITLFDQSGATLFHDEGNRGYATVSNAGGHRHLSLHSSETRLYFTKLFFDAYAKAIGARPLDEAINLLEAKARFAAPLYCVSLRQGGDAGNLVIDLGHIDGRMVRITAAGWSIGYSSEEKLVRSPGFGKLPVPTPSGDLRDFQRLLNLDENSWVLVLAFLLACLRPNGPYMLLLVEGEQGSGKRFFCKLLKRIIDPNQIEKARLPESERDLMIHAKDYFLLCFDNVSGMKRYLSDALCVLATGGGFATRKLYSDDELMVFNSTRPVIINGIADMVTQADLLERSIPLRLPSIDITSRKTEGEMLAEFDRLLPGILGCLYTIVVGGLKALPTTPAPTAIRMADIARWLVACESSAGLSPGTFVSVLSGAQNEVFIEHAQNDVVFGALAKLCESEPFEGTVQQLFDRINLFDAPPFDRVWPRSPAHLSRHLTRLKPAMAKAGIHFSFIGKTRLGKTVRVWLDGEPSPRRKPSLPMY